MAYTIIPHPKKEGRFRVISGKGKVWKTDYASRAAAEKGVAYVESRFGGGGSPSSDTRPSTESENPDTSAERKKLGIPEQVTEEGW